MKGRFFLETVVNVEFSFVLKMTFFATRREDPKTFMGDLPFWLGPQFLFGI